MNLPIYQILHVKNADLVEMAAMLQEGLNLHRPVALVVKSLGPDEQRELVDVIGNWFQTHQASWRFPYPVYIVSDVPEAVSRIPIVAELGQLPRFFQQKDAKITVKEAQVIDRNYLLQREIKNTDAHALAETLRNYGMNHKRIWFLAQETAFLESLLKRLRDKEKPRG